MVHHTDEFIGKNLAVAKSRSKSLDGLAGKIIDETKKSFTITTLSGNKQIPKEGCTFTIDGSTVNGDEIALRPEERIKRKK